VVLDVTLLAVTVEVAVLLGWLWKHRMKFNRRHGDGREGGWPQRAIRRRVRAELSLPISIGVARTKHLTKIASQVAKPDGLVVVDPETALFLIRHAKSSWDDTALSDK
jgi:nucleotidyltransferase/DNA polymerase involved in DNA repair